MKKIIVGENIIKSFAYGDKKRNVLDNLSIYTIYIREGQFLSVMGPSGCGSQHLCFPLVVWIELIREGLFLMEKIYLN